VAKCVHLICRNEDESGWGCKHLVSLKSEVEPGWWETGQWLFNNEEADSLKDGLIFLHHTKKTPAHFAGLVADWREIIADELITPERKIFKVKYISELRNTRWGLASHDRAWRSDIYEWTKKIPTSAD
jgi:hypothetical protein